MTKINKEKVSSWFLLKHKSGEWVYVNVRTDGRMTVANNMTQRNFGVNDESLAFIFNRSDKERVKIIGELLIEASKLQA